MGTSAKYPDIPPLPDRSRAVATRVIGALRVYRERKAALGPTLARVVELLREDRFLHGLFFDDLTDLDAVLANRQEFPSDARQGDQSRVDEHLVQLSERLEAEVRRAHPRSAE